MKRFIATGNRLKELRGLLSQQDFALQIGVPFRTYQRYEAGERLPKGPILQRIAQRCEITTDYILTGNDEDLAKHREIEDSFPGVDEITAKIIILLRDMDEERRREVLKYAKEKKLLMEFQGQNKKLGGGR